MFDRRCFVAGVWSRVFGRRGIFMGVCSGELGRRCLVAGVWSQVYYVGIAQVISQLCINIHNILKVISPENICSLVLSGKIRIRSSKVPTKKIFY